jgi:hypothetical protein
MNEDFAGKKRNKHEWKRRGSPSWIPSKLAQFVMGSLRIATPKLAEVWFGIR